MADIFLSYRSIESDFALKLAADLKNAGVKLWMDRLDAGIKVGDDWVQALQDALDDCAAVVAILSPDYVSSKYCRRELKRADALGKPIFPVLLDTLQKGEWPFEIQEKQYIDFRDWRDEHLYREQMSKLVDALGGRFPEQLCAAPDAETRYLTSLIAELESQKGVLEYVEISAQAEVQRTRPQPRRVEEWAPSFSILEEVVALTPNGPRGGREKTHLDSIQQAIGLHPRFVLLGVPGAGKTTSLRKLALDVARERLANPPLSPLPLLLYLPTWRENQSVNDFIRDAWPFKSDPEDPLRRGEVILYLDGLNEMGAKGVRNACHLREWLEKDCVQHVIITCRTDDYSEDLDLGLPKVSVEELDGSRIRQFCENYLGKREVKALLAHLGESMAMPEFAAPLFSGGEEKQQEARKTSERDKARSLLNLAKNPYLLAALIFVFKHTPTRTLPRNSGKLFQALARALWERERVKRTAGWIPFQEMEVAFARLAFAMIDEGQPLDVSLTYTLEKVGEETLLRSAHNANLVEIRGDRVRFYHQLMQDYFAAVRLGQVNFDNQLEEPCLYWHAERGRVARKWDQAIIALSGIIDDADELVRTIATVNPLLAADCIASGATTNAETRHCVQRQILRQVSEGRGCIIWAGTVALGDIADAGTVSQLLQILIDGEGWGMAWSIDGYWERGEKVHEAVENALYKLGETAVPGLIQALRWPESAIRRGAASALGRIGSAAAVPELIRLLKDEETGLYSSRICDVAAEALRKIGTPEALAAVRQWRREQKS